jgi:hypothetical protein
MLTTAGENSSARSAKLSGAVRAIAATDHNIIQAAMKTAPMKEEAKGAK